MSERDIAFAKLLANGGCVFDREIQQKTKEIVKTFPKTGLFLLAIAQSLTWTGHAIEKANYFEKSLNFLSTGSEQALSDLSEYAGRYGSERLISTLFNWRKLYNELNAPPDISELKIEEIILFQNTAYKTACTARRKRRIMNIGAWLFCAPFKILLCFRDDLWSHNRIDEIYMPLGLEVVRGVKKLKRQKYSYSEAIEIGFLEEEEGDIIDGLAIVHIVQALSKQIAQDVNSIVLHINSGLWKLGAGDL